MTKMKTIDCRGIAIPTFESIKVGDMFTEVNGELIYIKTAILKNENNFRSNAITFGGEACWFDDDEEIQIIQEIEISIKK